MVVDLIAIAVGWGLSWSRRPLPAREAEELDPACAETRRCLAVPSATFGLGRDEATTFS